VSNVITTYTHTQVLYGIRKTFIRSVLPYRKELLTQEVPVSKCFIPNAFKLFGPKNVVTRQNVFLIHLICFLHKRISHISSTSSILWNYILPTYNNMLSDSYLFPRWLIGYKLNPIIGNGCRWFGCCWLAIMQYLKLSGTAWSSIYDDLLLY
jgi:hypothetical protein